MNYFTFLSSALEGSVVRSLQSCMIGSVTDEHKCTVLQSGRHVGSVLSMMRCLLQLQSRYGGA